MDNMCTRIRTIFDDCLLPTDYTNDTKCISVCGVSAIFGINPDKIEEHREEIFKMMQALPIEFWESPIGSDGYTFLNLPFTKDGAQWGEQQNAQELMVLGITAGYMQYLFSKDYWEVLPGSVPYIVIHEKPIDVTVFTVKNIMDNHVFSSAPIIM